MGQLGLQESKWVSQKKKCQNMSRSAPLRSNTSSWTCCCLVCNNMTTVIFKHFGVSIFFCFISVKKPACLYEVSFFSALWMVFPESWKRSCPNFYAHDLMGGFICTFWYSLSSTSSILE